MGKKTKTTGKTRLDKYYHLAKEQGYRARSAFKLLQLNRKYDFLSSSRVLIDLCAAPGGWLQVAAKCMPVSSLIIGVDLVPIRPVPKCQTFVEDITTPKCRSTLRKAIANWTVDTVVHDGAPNVGGTWAKDAYGQSELALHALKLAVEFLRKGGTFVTKVFRSQDSNSLLWVVRQLFDRVEATKPASSRNTSAEIFFVCQGFRAPDKLDKRLLDPNVVFKSVANTTETVNVMKDKNTKKPRQRSGYEDGVMLLEKKLSAVEFVDADVPAEVLGKFNEIVFDEASAVYKSHALTTEEVQCLCSDLKVLGRSDFKKLLKWRRSMRGHRDQLAKQHDAAGDVVEEPKDDKEPETEEQREKRETEEIRTALERIEAKKKRAKSKVRAQKVRARVRQMGMVDVEEGANDAPNESMFSLNQMLNADELSEVQKADQAEVLSDSEEDNDSQEEEEVVSSDDGVDEQIRYVDMEHDLDAAYSVFKKARGIEDRLDKKAKKPKVGLAVSDSEGDDSEADLSGEDLGVDENPLKVALDESTSEPPSTSAADRWFSRELLAHLNDGDADDDADDQDQEPEQEQEEDVEEDLEEEEDEPNMGGPLAPARRAAAALALSNGFEEVPAMESDGWTSDSEAEAEMLAIGRMMLRKEKRRDIEDNSYNRYSFQDDGALPRWFAYDEEMHHKAALPVTKAEVNEEKERLLAINARPINKIAEARARNKMKAAKRWEKLKQQADTISARNDMSSDEKFKKLEALYKNKGKKKEKKQKQYVVSRKSSTKQAYGARKQNARTKMVDKRMKADKRGRDASERKDKRTASKKRRTK